MGFLFVPFLLFLSISRQEQGPPRSNESNFQGPPSSTGSKKTTLHAFQLNSTTAAMSHPRRHRSASRPGPPPRRSHHHSRSRRDSIPISPLTSPTQFQQALDNVSPLSDSFPEDTSSVSEESEDSEEEEQQQQPRGRQARRYKAYHPSIGKGKGRMTDDDDDDDILLQTLPSGARNLTPAVKMSRRGAVRQVQIEAAPQNLSRPQTAQVLNIAPQQAEIITLPPAPPRNSSNRQFTRGRPQQLMLSAIHTAEDMVHIPLPVTPRSHHHQQGPPGPACAPQELMDASFQRADEMERGEVVRRANTTGERRKKRSKDSCWRSVRWRWIGGFIIFLIVVFVPVVVTGQPN